MADGRLSEDQLRGLRYVITKLIHRGEGRTSGPPADEITRLWDEMKALETRWCIDTEPRRVAEFVIAESSAPSRDDVWQPVPVLFPSDEADPERRTGSALKRVGRPREAPSSR